MSALTVSTITYTGGPLVTRQCGVCIDALYYIYTDGLSIIRQTCVCIDGQYYNMYKRATGNETKWCLLMLCTTYTNKATGKKKQVVSWLLAMLQDKELH